MSPERPAPRLLHSNAEPAAVSGISWAVGANQLDSYTPGDAPLLGTTENYGWTVTIEMDDSRLSGRYETNQNVDQYLSTVAIKSGVGTLTNEGGSWAVEFHGFTPPTGNEYIAYLTGEGGYEGLSAMLVSRPSAYGRWAMEGVIYPGVLPEPPAWVLPPAE